MKLLVINNLAAGLADGSIYDYVRLMSTDRNEVSIRTTDGATDIKDLLTDATDYDMVVVSGGDGTLASAAFALAYTGVPILPFPAGTANLLANNLLEPMEPHALAKMTRAGKILEFDLGEIEVSGERFGFSIMAGAGYDAKIMHDAKPAKKLLGQMAYFQAAIANALPQVSKIDLTIDGETIHTEGLGVLLVNFSKIQFEITVTHNNEPRDGKFEIVVLKADNAFGLIPAFIDGLLDADGSHPGRADSLEIFSGNNVEIVADPPFEVQYDGEIPGLQTPLHAHVLNGAARFVLSDEGYERFKG